MARAETPGSSIGVLAVLIAPHLRKGRLVRQHEAIRRKRIRQARERAMLRSKATPFGVEE